MGTDAAFRFERGIDPEGLIRALNRAARLMAELSGGTVCRGVIDQYPRRIPTARNIPLRVKRTRDILGIAVPEAEMVRILKSLEMAVEPAGEGQFAVTPPTCRVDITREIDLIEEVARLYGYDRVPITLPAVSVVAGSGEAKRTVEERLREIMTGAGYTEVINYSFISPGAVDQLGLGEKDERRGHVVIRNPLTEEQAVMRTTMTYSLLLNARRNVDCGRFDIKIFEIGKTFIRHGEGIQPLEQNRMACLITGLRYEDRWHSRGLCSDFYDLKGCVENILDMLRISLPSFRSGIHEEILHPGKSCGVFSGDEMVGFLGEIHPDAPGPSGSAGTNRGMRDGYRSPGGPFLPERSLSAVSPRFPSSSRDVAFLIRRECEAGELLRLADESHEELLEKVQIFDVYEGENIAAGMKSLGLRFSYRSADRTLTDDEVNEVHARIVQRIVQRTGASIR